VLLYRNVRNDDEVDKQTKLNARIRDIGICTRIPDRNDVQLSTILGKVYDSGRNYILMKALGPNLADLIGACGGQLRMKTYLQIGVQFITEYEQLHHIGFRHYTMKTANVRISGRRDKQRRLYLVDFGRARLWKNFETDENIAAFISPNTGIPPVLEHPGRPPHVRHLFE